MKHSKLIALFSSFVMVAGLVALTPNLARADSYQCGSTDEHPLRIIAYVIHPIGVALEWGITRPVHWVASQPNLDILLGHVAKPGDVYFEWKHCDGSPGIAEIERQQREANLKKQIALLESQSSTSSGGGDSANSQ